MARLALLATGLVAAITLVAATTATATASASQPSEMQAQRQRSAAMTPQQARTACWQEAGFGPSTPRRNYPATLQPQVERCVRQKLGR
ncbi:hypothetical protein [Phreatobacter stygius]|uniref:DUF4148 domain-containing protein n=1 Tax=Phreatobacter stygius TaxID=1940610 RepID=A0A4D7BBV6_9HYPH|nr:hypothetical protein [Phreatobacter stygius]QCI67558.1 hypothetical protein E8M01_27045 [Phreatobacter stygius]